MRRATSGHTAVHRYIDSYISGDFEGWDGDAVYELDDGTQWALMAYRYLYAYHYRPRAVVWRDGDSYFLQVEGMTDRPEVRQIL